jgi:small subunit ribosomal protein S16
MVIIRLSRFGRKKAPFYRIIATDAGKKTTGQSLDTLGTWNPAKKILKVEREKINAWVKKGAQLSATVKKLLGGNKK